MNQAGKSKSNGSRSGFGSPDGVRSGFANKVGVRSGKCKHHQQKLQKCREQQKKTKIAEGLALRLIRNILGSIPTLRFCFIVNFKLFARNVIVRLKITI